MYIYICLCVYVEYPSYCPILTGNVPFSADGGVGLGHRLEIGQDDSGGINQPFPVMGGKNGIGLSTLGISWDFTGDFSWD